MFLPYFKKIKMDFFLQILQKWAIRKESFFSKKRITSFKTKEIWITELGINIGSEQNGNIKSFTRPCLIINKINNDTCIILPLTTTKRSSEVKISNYHFLSKKSWVMPFQIRTISTKRLKRNLGKISEENFQEIIKKSVEKIFSPPQCRMKR